MRALYPYLNRPLYNLLKRFATLASITLVLLLSYSVATAHHPFAPPATALNFDGTNDYINVPAQGTVVSGNYTVMAWVMPVHPTKAMHIFSTRESGEFSFDLQLTGGNKIHADIGNGSTFFTTSADANYNYAINRWVHIAYVVSPTGYKIYANGVQVGQGSFTGTPLLLNANHYITIGKNAAENTYFQGSIDEIKVYNTGLTETNVQTDMLSSTPSVPGSLVAHYNFDDIGTALTDHSGNGYNGTLNNFALSGGNSNWVESYAMVVPAISSATNITTNGFTLNWTAPVNGVADNYVLDVSSNSSFTAPVAGSPFTTTGATQAVSGLLSSTTYYYRVRANKTSVAGQGVYSPTTTVTTAVAYDYLSAITISNTILSPAFAETQLVYTGTVTMPAITISLVQDYVGSVIEINVNSGGYTVITSGSTSPDIPLNPGVNTIQVRVSDETDNRVYTFTITRLLPVIRYVKQGGAGSKDGSSWANASDDLQLMINHSSTYDMVWVAGGLYKPNRRADGLNTITPGDRYNAFVLKKDVLVYGGFAGTENSLNERNPGIIANKSILSGDFNGDDMISGSGSNTLRISNNGENARHVFVSAGNTGNALLDGFTLMGGNADAGGSIIFVNSIIVDPFLGGGMVNYQSSLTLNNITITHNGAVNGAGIGNQGASPTLTNLIIHENAAIGGSYDNLGGGMANYTSSSPKLINVTISGNVSTSGGGMYNRSSSPWLTNVTIKNNHARGNAFYLSGGGISNETSASPVLTNVLITGNTAKTGGGIDNFKASPVLTNVTISGNMASSAGGGMYSEGTPSVPQATNCIIWGNNTGVSNSGVSPVITNSIVQGGYAGAGNKDETPAFINAVRGDYRLQSGSGAINAGSNLPFTTGQTPDLSAIRTDLDGNARTFDGTVDMGAYEKQAAVAALNFDGVNDKIVFGAPGTPVSGSYTVEAWVRPTDASKTMDILSTKYPDGNGFDIQLKDGNTIHGTIGDGATLLATQADAAYTYDLGRWIHIAYSVSPQGYTIYVNGESAGSGTFSGNPLLMDGTHILQIGNNGSGNTFFKGDIDEVRIYDAALTQADIVADMINTSAVLPDHLVAHYNFDDGLPGGNNAGLVTLADKSAAGYSGTLQGFALTGQVGNWTESYAMVVPGAAIPISLSATSFTANWEIPMQGIVDNGYVLEVATDKDFIAPVAGSPFMVSGTSHTIAGLLPGNTYYYKVRAEKISVAGHGAYSRTIPILLQQYAPPGNALNFDGQNDYVSVQPQVTEVSGNFTVMAWVRPTNATKAMHIFSTRESGESSFDMQLVGGTKIHGDIGTGSSWLTNTADANYRYKVNQWIHVAYAVSPSGYKIYVNGAMIGENTLSNSALLLNATHKIVIGKNTNENTYFQGDIDEVKVYSAALTAEQIQVDMVNITSSIPGSLVAYYNFDQATTSQSDVLSDQGVNGYNGTLYNFALSGGSSNWVESYAMVMPVITAEGGISSTGFTANWTAPAVGIVDNGYVLEVSTDRFFAILVGGAPFATTGLSQVITGLTPNTKYYYRVRADKLSLTGHGAYSDTAAITLNISLPVGLIDFTAIPQGNKVKLQWSTATENNNKEFTIKRSTDGIHFSVIGRVAGNGTTSNRSDYTFYDNDPASGNNFYQLAQTDFDGVTRDLGIRRVTFQQLSSAMQFYPNPTVSAVYITLPAGRYSSLVVSDLSGKIVRTQSVGGRAQLAEVPLGGYPAGVYMIRLSGSGGTFTGTVIKK